MPTAHVKTAEEHVEDIRKEYATYVALTPIDINGGRAFNVGDPVPTSHVDDGVVRAHQVAKRTTKGGAAALAESPTSPSEV